MANPEVNPQALRLPADGARPAFVAAVEKRVVERFAALKKAEPVQLPDGGFAYRFAELESEIKDVEEYRKNVDLGKYQVGKVVFDSGS